MVSNQDELTQWVLRVMEQTPNARLREIMIALVTHLHGFVRDAKLTEEEFRSATALIAKLGQQTNDSHNEVVLMAGSLGVSSLVCLMNNTGAPASDSALSTQNLLGPFWRMNSPATENGASIVRSPTPGAALLVEVVIKDANGAPVQGALVDIWHCAPDGLYENQLEARAKGQTDMNLRGQFTTDAQGEFRFWSVMPVGYPIPVDGVVGQLLLAQKRHPMRPAHVHALAYKEGYKTLISQVYVGDDENLASDAQFGVTEAVTGQYIKHSVVPASRPQLQGDWFSLNFTFLMQAGEAKLPKPPIK